MPFTQFDLISQFCITIVGLLVIQAVALKVYRMLARPSGTYGAGLPERRARKRIVLRDPDVVAARLRDPGSRSAA
jgi:hypothetical protein